MIRVSFFIFLIGIAIAEEKITTHTSPFPYTATVSSGGKVTYIAYTRESETNRPITFAFNGGPGGSSCFLHLGVLGPRRFMGPEEGGKLTPPYQLIDNLETLLDVTDLVFVDPSGTGLSESDDSCFSIQSDIESVGTFIRDYLTQNSRWNSPKYLAGESYGAARAIGIADYLQDQHGIYLNGLILISAAIDFQVFFFDADNQLPYFLFLPSYATTAWYHKKAHLGLTLEEVAQKARKFAYQSYAPSLLCPKCKGIESLYSELAEMTGLSIDTIEWSRGKIGDGIFLYSLLQDERKRVGRFDSRVSGYYAHSYQDPSATNIIGPLSAALHEYLNKELGMQNSYTIFSEKVNEEWDFKDYNEWGYPNLMNALRQTLIANPSMKIFVACGYFDLATPFAAVEYCMDHLDVPKTKIEMNYYEGGHMFYFNPEARIKFKQDLTRFIGNP